MPRRKRPTCTSSSTSSRSSSRANSSSPRPTSRHPLRAQLPQERYQVFDRDTQVQVELFRPENVPLETEEAKLSQQYQKLSGSLTVQFRGEEKTLVQMGRYLEEPDRPLRQEAWELVANRRLQEAEKFEEIFEQLVKLREQIASNAGYANYRDYAFRRLGRFDYTPADCVQFHEAVETEVMPVVRELQAERQRQLGVETLRPWDLAVDPLNRPPLRPFEQVDQMVSRTQEIFERLDRDLAAGFQRMQDLRLLDLANRKGKAPGGYQSTLAEARVPFIFMNAVGLQRDVETILHEAGHAFHALATRDEDLLRLPQRAHRVLRSGLDEHGVAGQRVPGEVLCRAGGQSRPPHAPGRDREHPSLDRDGGCVPALDLHAPGPHAGGADRGVAGADGPVRRRRWTGADTKRRGPISGTASCTSSSTPSITSNTASPSSARCRSGPTRSATRPSA